MFIVQNHILCCNFRVLHETVSIATEVWLLGTKTHADFYTAVLFLAADYNQAYICFQ